MNVDFSALNRSIDHPRKTIEVAPAPAPDHLNMTMPLNFNPALHKDEEPEAKTKFKQQIQQDLKKLRQKIDHEVGSARKPNHIIGAENPSRIVKEGSPSPERYQFVQTLNQQFS